MLIIYVKGNEDDARKACEARGIEGFQAERYIPDSDWQIGYVPEQYRAACVAWLCEKAVAIEGQGFPKGTLLVHG